MELEDRRRTWGLRIVLWVVIGVLVLGVLELLFWLTVLGILLLRSLR